MVHTVFCLLRLAVLFVSLGGLIAWVNKRIGVIEFAMPVTFAGIGVCMFLAGILNILVEASVLILGAGIIAGADAIREHRRIRLSRSVVFWLAVSAALVLILYGHRVIIYDEFSHWALSLKYMLAGNRFPSYMDKNIGFTSYQIGNLAFIYFIVLISGIQEEWFWYVCQGILTLTMLLPLFVFFKRNSTFVAVGLTANIMLYVNGGVGALVVDTLLPFVMLDGLLLCIYFRDDLLSKFWAVAVFAVYLTAIKTTGVLYAAILMGYALYCIPRPWSKKLVFTAISPFAEYYLWARHVKLVFPNGMNSRHAVSVAWFSAVLHGKSIMSIVKVTAKIVLRFFSPTNPFVLLVVFWLAAEYYAKKHEIKKERIDREIEAVILGSTILYEIGLWGMYVFSMPQVDAAILSSYERYYMTQMFVVFGLALVRFRNLLEKLPRFIKKTCGQKTVLTSIICVFFLFNMVLCKVVVLNEIEKMFPQRVRTETETLIQQNQVQSEQRYLLVSDIEDYGYRYYLLIYLLDPLKLEQATQEEYHQMDEPKQQYDYVIFISQNGGNTVQQLK